MNPFAKYAKKEGENPFAAYSKPVEKNTNGMPKDFVGPPTVQEQFPELPPGVPMERVRGRDPATGTITLAPEPGKEVRGVLTDDKGKQVVNMSSAEAKDFANRPPYDPMKGMKALAGGALDVATMGLGDEAAGLQSMIGGGSYEKGKQDADEAIKESKAGDPLMALAGGGVAALPQMATPAGMGVLKAAALGAGTGGLTAFGSTDKRLVGEDSDAKGVVWDTLKGAAMGGGPALALGAAGKVAQRIARAPERVAERADKLLFDTAMKGLSPTDREAVMGRLVENEGDIIRTIKEDPQLRAAVMALGENTSKETAKAAALVADDRMKLAKREAADVVTDLSGERGPIPGGQAIDTLDTQAGWLRGKLDPEAGKAADSIAKHAQKIKDEIMPVKSRALVSKIADKAGTWEKEAIAKDRKVFDDLADSYNLGIYADDPADMQSAIVSAKNSIGQKIGDFRKRTGDISLSEFTKAITDAAREAQAKAPAVERLAHSAEAQADLLALWRKHAPGMVDEAGNIGGKFRKNSDILGATISFDDAREELSAMQAQAFVAPGVAPTAAEKARRQTAIAAKEHLIEQVSKNLSPEEAKEFQRLNTEWSRLQTMEDAIHPQAVASILGPEAPKRLTRAGSIDLGDALSAAKGAKQPEVQDALNQVISSHIGEDGVSRIRTAEAKANAAEMLADALARQARREAAVSPASLRGLHGEAKGDVGRAAGGAALAALATGNPIAAAGLGAGAVATTGGFAKAANTIDKGIAAMVSAARRGASIKQLEKLGSMVGIASDVSANAARMISSRILTTDIGKDE